jgi:GAF domain-containing protein/HAMP domain-containing protein
MTISLHPDTPEGRTLAAPVVAPAASAASSLGSRIRSRLFTKYVALFVAVVAVALLSNGIFEVFFYYREHKASLIRIQHEQAEAAAAKISQFIKEIESQLGWTTQLPWSAGSIEQRRFDALRLLRQVPAITELAQVDSTGKERLRVSRLAMDVVDSGLDLSKDPKFTEAVAKKVYYGPVYFRRESEPYMTLALAGTRKDAGVSIAEVNLKLIWDVVSQIKVGEHGHAYVVGSQGRLIAHPDISLVLRNTDMSKLVQVQAALEEQARLIEQQEAAAAAMQAAQAASGSRTTPLPAPPPPQAATVNTDSLQGAKNVQGQEVLTASAPIQPLRWIMFVELPVEEAYASLYAALQRLAIVLTAASLFAVLAGIFLARRMVGPIQALRAGAARIGGGDFSQRISIPTGDELEGLANQFNDMGARLQESYADLENKVESRTAELSETLQQQTATSEVLKVISSSAFDLQPVFNTIVQTASRLCEAEFALIFKLQGDRYEIIAANNAADAFVKHATEHPIQLGRGSLIGRTALERKPVHIPDCMADPEYSAMDYQVVGKYRTMLGVPLLREGEPIGVISLMRTAVRPFSDKQIELVTTFADQAVIAIQNVRLFDEVQERTHELTESLEQQTATSEVLEVISSSPGELEPVFKKMLENAARVCGANFGTMNLWDGKRFNLVADHNVPPELVAMRQAMTMNLHPDAPMAQILRTHKVVHVADLRTSPAYLADNPNAVALADIAGARTLVVVPMLKEDELIGVISIFRKEVRPFADKQVALLENFTKQAVIAIENTRLLKELRQRTDDLTESLEQQTATSEVLEVISSSPGELQPVFRKMLENATRVCGAKFGTMNLWDGEKFNLVADHNIPAEFSAFRQRTPISAQPGTLFAAMTETHQAIQVDDLRESPGYKAGFPHAVGMADIAGARTLLMVPMLKENELMGAITIIRQEVRPFTDKQMALVVNFTKQAVIAIENTRLLKELRARTDDLTESLQQQTATSEVLETISSSAGELEPVFSKMLENATRVCGARFGTMTLYEDGGFRTVALYNAPKAYADTELYKVIRPHPEGGLSTVEKTHDAVQIDDLRSEPPYIEGNPNVRALADLAGARTIVIVPMLKEDDLIGTIAIFRQEVKPFTDKQIELVANFANQAVIAIENARLLNELRERTEELSRSLDDLRTAQDRLIQTEKLASLGQLTAGIAHEIKNPLNFVNNFSSLSTELIDELNDVLKSAGIDDNRREEIDELTHMLKGNLEKVVQHGKRADSIVKNMLLHSREGSGEHRPADINAIVEESLNLAYHGARAEKSGFNITLKRDLDPDAGMIDLYPQEITRVFLNLISNGFYAATKRKESAREGFEPTLSASTRSFGNKVEIRIRDNGTGIPKEVKEKMFNPFFTTKPAGEGTGLGLSMSHDIVVKQHGGKIDVDTEPGVFTEFIITLPRKLAAQSNTGGSP